MKNVRGFSIAELVVGIAVGGVTMLAVGQAISSMATVDVGARLQRLADEHYFHAMQIARSPAAFKALVSKMNDKDLSECLGNRGKGCRALQKADQPLVGFTFDPSINGLVSLHGVCATGSPPPANANAPGCVIRRQAVYHWECPSDTYCTGVRTTITVDAVADTDGRVPPLRPRTGSFVLYSRAFQSKGQIIFGCSRPLAQIDYNKLVNDQNDTCSDIDPGAPCGIAARSWGGSEPDNCQPQQQKTCAGNDMQTGFSEIGMYQQQDQCAPAQVFAPVLAPQPPPGVTCPNGGVVAMDGSCHYANRWCPLAGPTGPETGFVAADPGMVMQAGCGWIPDGRFYPPGAIASASTGKGMIYAVCKSGPADQFPLPDSYCASAAPTTGNWTYGGPTMAIMTMQNVCYGKPGWNAFIAPRYPYSPPGSACSPVGDTCIYSYLVGNAISGPLIINYVLEICK